ncbi:Hypothetical protein A7982_11541 [Minicystis rosea]|nr:Hypothetical protein A7982_11541 [Minicystis rosea]
MLGLGGEDEARIARETRVMRAVVMIDPGREARAEALDEGERGRLEAVAPASEAKAMSSTATLPRSSRTLGSLRGEAKARSKSEDEVMWPAAVR